MSDGEWKPDPNRNVYGNAPEGAYAIVAPSAKVGARLGYWTQIGDGAVVPATVHLGSWSKVGHFSRIGAGVWFGDWAGVGMDCRVDAFSRLGSHEYIPSGHRRHVDGRVTRLAVEPEDAQLHFLYDHGMNAHGWNMGPQAIPMAIANEENARAKRHLLALTELLPAYLERRKAARPVGFLARLLRLSPATPIPTGERR